MKPHTGPKVLPDTAQGEQGGKPTRTGDPHEEQQNGETPNQGGNVKPGPKPQPIGDDPELFAPRATDPVPRRDPHHR